MNCDPPGRAALLRGRRTPKTVFLLIPLRGEKWYNMHNFAQLWRFVFIYRASNMMKKIARCAVAVACAFAHWSVTLVGDMSIKRVCPLTEIILQ